MRDAPTYLCMNYMHVWHEGKMRMSTLYLCHVYVEVRRAFVVLCHASELVQLCTTLVHLLDVAFVLVHQARDVVL